MIDSNVTRQRRRNKAPAHTLSSLQKQEVAIISKRQFNKGLEAKFYRGGVTQSFSQTTQVTSLTDVPQGTGDSNRVGDTLTPVSLQLRYQIDQNVASAVKAEYVRVFVFQWFPSTANLVPAGTTIFLGDFLAGSINQRSYWSKDYMTPGAAQFRVLYDKLHLIIGFGTSTAYNTSQGIWVDKEISLASARKTIQYTASTTDGAGKIFVGTIGSTNTNPSALSLVTMFRYKDG